MTPQEQGDMDHDLITEKAIPIQQNEAASLGPSRSNSQQLPRPESTESTTRPTRSLPEEILFLTVLCSAQLLTQSGLAMSIVPQRIIGSSFGVANDPGTLSWFSAGYSLTVGTFILIAGRLGDLFGYKRFFIGGAIWMGVWSAVSGFAVWTGPAFFAFCRAMQGIGPALMLPNAIAIIARQYSTGMRQNIAFSLFGATAPGGFAVGAAFSSLLAEKLWWPWAFWIMCFACLVLTALSFFAIPATSKSADTNADVVTNSSIWQRIDIYGCLTGVSSLILFNFAWNQGPVVGWQTPYTYILLIVGILLFVVFIIIEKRVSHPLVPFGALKIDALFTLACIVCGWGSFGIFVYYALDLLQVLRGISPLLTAAQVSPIAISGLCAAVTTGLSLSKLRPSTVMTIAMLAFLVGGIIIATIPVEQTYWAQTFVGLIILPWGMDMSFPAATIILSRAMSRENQGLASSLVNTFVNYSISIGLGVAGTVSTQVNDGGRDLLGGIRGAFYLGVGLSGLGVLLALVFCFVERYRSEEVREEQVEV